jgi:hypothetical protein
MVAKQEWDTKYASTKRRVQKQRAREIAKGYLEFGDGEVPPPSALAGRRKVGVEMREENKKRSYGLGLWSLWGSKHDEKAITLEQQNEKEPETKVATSQEGQGARPIDDTKTRQGKLMDQGQNPPYNRSRSRRRTVTDEHQTENVDENIPAADLLAVKKASTGGMSDEHLTPDFAKVGEQSTNVADDPTTPSILISEPPNDGEREKRPRVDGIAVPFSLKKHSASASMTTLTSHAGIIGDVRTEGAVASGVKENAKDIEAVTATGFSTEAEKARRASVAPADEVVLNGSGKGKEATWDDTKYPEPATAISSGIQSSDPTISSKIAEKGQIVSGERPPLETFITAMEEFPKVSAEKA